MCDHVCFNFKSVLRFNALAAAVDSDVWDRIEGLRPFVADKAMAPANVVEACEQQPGTSPVVLHMLWLWARAACKTISLPSLSVRLSH